MGELSNCNGLAIQYRIEIINSITEREEIMEGLKKMKEGKTAVEFIKRRG